MVVNSIPDDRELLEAFRKGSLPALTLIYRQHVKEVAYLVQRGFVLSRTQHINIPGIQHADTEQELVQEVFAKAFSDKARQGYDGQRPYRPYLMKIAKNIVIDHWRAQGKDTPYSHQDLEDLLNAESSANLLATDQEDTLDWKNQLKATQEFLALQDQKTQEFVTLRFEERKSQPELAAQLGVTRWQIRKMEKTVLAKLKRYLKKRGLFS